MIKAILFDFNGVIINDEPIQMRAYQEVLGKEGIALTKEGYYARLGMDDRTFVTDVYREAGKEPETNKILEITLAKSAKWREMVTDELPLFPGVVDFIKKMANDFALGIVSMARREEIEHVLQASELGDCFSIIISAADVENCKPDPECFVKGFNQLDSFRIKRQHLPMVHGECLVIEDSPPGIMAAKNAGLKALGVTNTVPADELRAAGADAVTKNLDDWMPGSIRGVFN